MTDIVSIEKNGVQTNVGTLIGDRPENAVFAYTPEYLAADHTIPMEVC